MILMPYTFFTFGNLSKPINSSLIKSYLEKDEDEDIISDILTFLIFQ